MVGFIVGLFFGILAGMAIVGVYAYFKEEKAFWRKNGMEGFLKDRSKKW